MVFSDEALARFRARVHEPRQYGVNDCCIAVADVYAMSGLADPMALFGRDYRSATGIARIFKKHGCGDLREAMQQVLTLAAQEAGAPVAEGAPQEGDLGMILAGGDGITVAIPAFFHNGFYHGQTHDGLAVMAEAMIAWRWPSHRQ